MEKWFRVLVVICIGYVSIEELSFGLRVGDLNLLLL